MKTFKTPTQEQLDNVQCSDCMLFVPKDDTSFSIRLFLSNKHHYFVFEWNEHYEAFLLTTIKQGRNVYTNFYKRDIKNFYQEWVHRITNFATLYTPEPEMDFEEKLRTGYYSKVEVEYPSYFDKSALIKSIENTFIGTLVQINAEIDRKVEEGKAEHKKSLIAYNESRQNKENEFKNDLFAYHDVSENPKREKCYALAYERGSSGGHSEVAGIFSELVELIN